MCWLEIIIAAIIGWPVIGLMFMGYCYFSEKRSERRFIKRMDYD